jgi:hypothetical protein
VTLLREGKRVAQTEVQVPARRFEDSPARFSGLPSGSYDAQLEGVRMQTILFKCIQLREGETALYNGITSPVADGTVGKTTVTSYCRTQDSAQKKR